MTIEQKPTGSFARASVAAPSWIEQNKALVIRLSVVAIAVIFIVVAGSIWVSNQAQKAQDAFNLGMQAYDSPIQQPGVRPMPGATVYASVAARGKAANPLFRDAADKYGSFKAGKNALYFAGLSAEDMGDNAQAEADLKKVADGGDAGLGALAKMALASLYVQTGRQSQAVALYNDLVAHPTLTVSANAARLAIAGMEESTNPQAARELYAKIKDSDKAGIAGEIATSKLKGK